MPRPSRREVLRLGASLGATSFAGCSALSFSEKRLTVTLLNFDSRSHTLLLELLRTDSDETVFRNRFTLDTPTDGKAAFERQRTGVVESREYRVRASLPGGDVERHYRFYPNPECSGGDESDELVVEIHGSDGKTPTIEFLRNGTIRCD
ncbi:hypothetical protein BG842_24530 [Haladaptatus sp. W1]|uniref:hypothetical protein n=1 Tax=Haladaptatus sp. W1 TaxID=1897478 RepID=UPI000849961B|nr:hypothetical protein [Haladaptatus sp. W1]ODR82535.1 hypothetical protein BG842_24530 [Haladaptatus sp. W1]